MASIQLVTVEDVAQRLNTSLNENGESEVLDSVISGATSMLATLLQSELYEADIVDTYYIPRWRTTDPVRLWTTRQFLKEGTVNVYLSCCGNKVDLVPANLVADSGLNIDLRRGCIDVMDQFVTDKSYMAVSYTAGFSTNDAAIPSWMKEAAISGAIYLHKMQAVRHGKKLENAQMTRELYSIMRQQVSPQLFTQHSGLTPDYSREVI